VTLALHAAGIDRCELNALFSEVLAETTRMLAAKLRLQVIVYAPARLRLPNKVKATDGVFRFCTFYFLFSIFCFIDCGLLKRT
jgi:hypothetical protein